MDKSLSSYLRSRMLQAVASGRSCPSVAMQFAVAPSAAFRLVPHVEQTGNRDRVKQGFPFGYGKLEPHLEFLFVALAKQLDDTLPDIAAILKAERNIVIHPGHLSKVLCKAGFTYETLLAAEQERADVKAVRVDW